MVPSPPVAVSGAVEGLVDVAVLRRLFLEAGLRAGDIIPHSGKVNLLRQLPAYNLAARSSPWVVLLDLDHDGPCAGEYVRGLLERREPELYLRVAVRAAEAWLLADADGIARVFEVPPDAVPPAPDTLDHPKRALVALARESRSAAVREGMTPRPGGRRSVGVEYVSRILAFIREEWSPAHGSARSPSLRRCRERLLELASRGSTP